jgi:hypothetical protein
MNSEAKAKRLASQIWNCWIQITVDSPLIVWYIFYDEAIQTRLREL